MIYLTKTDFLVMLEFQFQNKNLSFEKIEKEIKDRCNRSLRISIDSLIYYDVLKETRIKDKGKIKKAYSVTENGIRLINILRKLGDRK